jgi:hypothetical protein
MPAFQRRFLDQALYDERELIRVLCMRSTLHLVPSHRTTHFFQSYSRSQVALTRSRIEALLVEAELCEANHAGHLLEDLLGRVLELLSDGRASTVKELSQALPELQAKVRHDVGKPYEGSYSIGSRLVPGMCDMGLLVRARPRGTWRSSLYEYTALSDWLPDVDLASVPTAEARSWLVRSYLGAFGPSTLGDIQWWTGFSRSETAEILGFLRAELVEVTIAGLGPGHLMLAGDVRRFSNFVPPSSPHSFFLPGLDPYIMGYKSRGRFLAREHRSKVLDRAGNAMPTVWINGRVAGAWAQRKDGTVVYDFFGPVDDGDTVLVATRARNLERFLNGEVLAQRSHTPFTRGLIRPVAG